MSVLDLAVADGVATLTLNRPESLNALNLELIAALRDATARVEHDPAVRVVVIRGAGEHFMAGGDLKWFRSQLDHPAAERQAIYENVVESVQSIVLRLRRMDKPVIAAVRGAAAGFGLSLVLACDLAVASESAYFTLAYRHIALSPDGGATWTLPRLVGMKKAAEIALLGDRFDARAARDLGLINQVVGDAEFDAAVAKLARRLASGPREALGRTKALLQQAFETSFAEQLAGEQRDFAACAARPDFDEGLAAFFEKRAAKFS